MHVSVSPPCGWYVTAKMGLMADDRNCWGFVWPNEWPGQRASARSLEQEGFCWDSGLEIMIWHNMLSGVIIWWHSLSSRERPLPLNCTLVHLTRSAKLGHAAVTENTFCVLYISDVFYPFRNCKMSLYHSFKAGLVCCSQAETERHMTLPFKHAWEQGPEYHFTVWKSSCIALIIWGPGGACEHQIAMTSYCISINCWQAHSCRSLFSLGTMIPNVW